VLSISFKIIDTFQTQGHQWDQVLLCLAHIRFKLFRRVQICVLQRPVKF